MDNGLLSRCVLRPPLLVMLLQVLGRIERLRSSRNHLCTPAMSMRRPPLCSAHTLHVGKVLLL
jgi:hypothetical protein